MYIYIYVCVCVCVCVCLVWLRMLEKPKLSFDIGSITKIPQKHFSQSLLSGWSFRNG